MHAALDDPAVSKVVAMKSAQVAWTDGVLLNYIGKRIDIDPCPMIVMFAKDQAAREFNAEKFTPMVEVTPRLAVKIPIHKSRDRDNRAEFKAFPGGFLKFVGSNSPSSVKSTPAPVVCVEEPDDCNENVRDQGDTITLLEERAKSYKRSKVIFGGTPTIEGVSRTEAAYRGSDQRKFFVPCHHCGEEHVLAWENVRWVEDPDFSHEVFGHVRPETAAYCCPHCGGLWSDAEKNRNVRRMTCRATAPFYGVAGFYINELYSPFPGSTLQKLLTKYLTAKHALAQGDDTKMRSFRNNTEGLPYTYASDLPAESVLKDRAEQYDEFTVPAGGMVLTAGLDVQHDRVAVIIRAWGRGEESWLIYWGEIHGQTVVAEQGVWPFVDELLGRTFKHDCGTGLQIRAFTIDSSDGQTSDAVYQFVRARIRRGAMAGKGASDDNGREIFTPPKLSVDANRQNSKAHKYGLRPFIVGTQRAKDLILGFDAGAGRLKLTGQGPGRMHWYAAVRGDYYEQLLAEVKVPHRTIRGKKVWQKKAGVRNEALDCEVYALHAARSLKLNLWKESAWAALDAKIKQSELFCEVQTPALPDTPPASEGDQGAPPEDGSAPPAVVPAAEAAPPAAVQKAKKAASSGLFNAQKAGGFSATRW